MTFWCCCGEQPPPPDIEVPFEFFTRFGMVQTAQGSDAYQEGRADVRVTVGRVRDTTTPQINTFHNRYHGVFFASASTIPPGKLIKSAKIQLRKSAGFVTTSTHTVHVIHAVFVPSNWDPNNFFWNQAGVFTNPDPTFPTQSPPITWQTVGDFPLSGDLDIDVTSQIQGQVNAPGWSFNQKMLFFLKCVNATEVVSTILDVDKKVWRSTDVNSDEVSDPTRKTRLVITM